MANYQGGYDCEFFEKPPKSTQSECPVCLQVLKDPYQVNCCGYAFCRSCVERIQRDNKPCPCCNAERFDKFEDKRLKRSLYEFKVHCSNKEQGCQWVGELGQLGNHLNINPSQQNQLQGCQLSQIKCLHCPELFLRPDIEDHQNNQCPRRPFSCEYCKEFDSCYEEVTTNHWPVCGSYPMPCTNKCGEMLQRQNLENHIANDCPLTIINCDFQHVGCEVRLPRKDMLDHQNESVITHMSLHIAKIEEENKQLKRQVEELEKSVQKVPPHLFFVKNFSQYRKDNNYWMSPTFYSHHRGYKMQLMILLNMSIYTGICIRILRGEYDMDLTWPFHGSVTVTLIGENNLQYACTQMCNENNKKHGEEDNNKCVHFISGVQKFSIHKYLINDKLYIKVSDICILAPE